MSKRPPLWHFNNQPHPRCWLGGGGGVGTWWWCYDDDDDDSGAMMMMMSRVVGSGGGDDEVMVRMMILRVAVGCRGGGGGMVVTGGVDVWCGCGDDGVGYVTAIVVEWQLSWVWWRWCGDVVAVVVCRLK
ncbi:hypothetical protein Tco_1343754 [Tanacetum coccineum]